MPRGPSKSKIYQPDLIRFYQTDYEINRGQMKNRIYIIHNSHINHTNTPIKYDDEFGINLFVDQE